MRFTRPGARYRRGVRPNSRSNSRARSSRSTMAAQLRHSQPRDRERQDHQTPDEIDVDAKRSSVDRLVAEHAIRYEQHTHSREHQSDWHAHVESHRFAPVRLKSDATGSWPRTPPFFWWCPALAGPR